MRPHCVGRRLACRERGDESPRNGIPEPSPCGTRVKARALRQSLMLRDYRTLTVGRWYRPPMTNPSSSRVSMTRWARPSPILNWRDIWPEVI